MQPKKPRFNPLILALALAAVLMVWSVLGGGSSSGGSSSMVYSTAVQYFENLQVTKFTLDLNTGVLTMTLKEGKMDLPDPSSVSTVQSTGGLLSGMLSSSSSGSTGAEKNSDGTVTVRYKLPYASMFVKNVDSYIAAYDEANPDAPMEYDYTPLKESIPWMEILFYLAMLGCTGFLLFSMMRGGGAGGGIMNVGKARVKDERENKKTATFADVAGEDEEKEELKEVVEFLKSPDKFNTLGARIPHGVLLVGPPGTGKTLLARACAGEAGVPFYSISGSDFVEMYVGVGASRVRDLFDKAKKTMPCIIFIDEIDAVGRQRGAGLGGGHDEREQTLNQLLVEMDGFEANDGIIVMAATNRADILDKALLRPGRFDRQVFVGLPDVKGREEILKVHTKNKPLAPDVSLKVIAQRTAGFAGADLENLVNEAALLAARRSRKAITMEDIEEASMKVMAGPEKEEPCGYPGGEKAHRVPRGRPCRGRLLLQASPPCARDHHHSPRSGRWLHHVPAGKGSQLCDQGRNVRGHRVQPGRPCGRAADPGGYLHRCLQRPAAGHQHCPADDHQVRLLGASGPGGLRHLPGGDFPGP